MGHDAQLVQGGLPVEQHHVSVYQVSLYNVAELELLGHLFPISILQEPEGEGFTWSLDSVLYTPKRHSLSGMHATVPASTTVKQVNPPEWGALPFHLHVSLLDEIGSWVNIRTISNQFPQKIDVCFVHLRDHDKKQ